MKIVDPGYNDGQVRAVSTGSANGLSTYISWSVLNDHLKQTGVLRPHEFLKGVMVDDDGVTIYLATKGD